MSLDISLECPCCQNDLYSSNITHNLNTMAEKAGVYEILWRAPENNINLAKDLIPYLKKGLNNLEEKPEYFKKFNPENDYGCYLDLLEFVEQLLTNCEMYPTAEVFVSR